MLKLQNKIIHVYNKQEIQYMASKSSFFTFYIVITTNPIKKDGRVSSVDPFQNAFHSSIWRWDLS